MSIVERPATSTIPPLKPGRAIEGISAVLLPYKSDDQPDWESFRRLLDGTWSAGLTPAVNMDTGYVNLLTPAERERVLSETAEVSRTRGFVAGAFIEGEQGDPAAAYLRAIKQIRARGGTPILFQTSALGETSEQHVLDAYARVAQSGGPLLAFELGKMFAPFGRIYSEDFFQRLLDRHRPAFKLYTGNDLAIDMVFYGSDYLLGLSAFAVDAFALRDRLWAAGDSEAVALNDLLQYLGQFAFRAPVPGYKHSAAQFLKLRGVIPGDRPHPRSPRRPESDVALLDDIRDRLEAVLASHAS